MQLMHLCKPKISNEMLMWSTVEITKDPSNTFKLGLLLFGSFDSVKVACGVPHEMSNLFFYTDLITCTFDLTN